MLTQKKNQGKVNMGLETVMPLGNSLSFKFILSIKGYFTQQDNIKN